MAKGWHGDAAGHARAAKKGHRRLKKVGRSLAKGSIRAMDTKAVSIAGKIYALKKSGVLPKGRSTIMSIKRRKKK